MRNKLAAVLLWFMIVNAESAKILGLFPYPGKSHYVMFEVLMKGLADRGHEVFVYSHFPQKKPIPHFTDVSLVGSIPSVVNAIPLDDFNVFGTLAHLRQLSMGVCERVLAHDSIQRLINTTESFDLIFTEVFNSDCFLPFVHKFKVPNIALCSHILMPWTTDRLAIPDNPAYIPNHFLPFSDHMTFKQRLVNTLALVLQKLGYEYFVQKPTYDVVSKYFGSNVPPLDEIAKNTSLLLINTSPVLNQARPLPPTVIEVGGIHIRPPSKLPQDLQKYLDEAEHGVIYFTYGSTVRSETFPPEKRKALLEAFSELPQKIIWKWEADSLPDQPSNVLVRKWLPQFDILSHPNVKLFITHGGLMGTMEAVHNGVPMVGMPLFGDQDNNVMACVERGVSVKLRYQDITKESLLAAIKKVLNDPGYKKRAVQLSLAFRDMPLSPMDTAIYWTEYILRHKGAPHLRSSAVDLPLYQYLLFDVIVILGSIVTLFLSVFLVTIKMLLCKTSSADKKLGKKKKMH